MNRKGICILTIIVTLFLTSGTICLADANSEIINQNIFQTTTSTNSTTNIIQGHCNGDGVKFKAAPSAGSTTLGLCYKNEVLYRYPSPAGTPSSWIYVYRPKTGQDGYIASQYFTPDIKPNSI